MFCTRMRNCTQCHSYKIAHLGLFSSIILGWSSIETDMLKVGYELLKSTMCPFEKMSNSNNKLLNNPKTYPYEEMLFLYWTLNLVRWDLLEAGVRIYKIRKYLTKIHQLSWDIGFKWQIPCILKYQNDKTYFFATKLLQKENTLTLNYASWVCFLPLVVPIISFKNDIPEPKVISI